MRLGEQMEDDLAVDGGLENGAALLEFVAQQGGVDEVAVVPDGELAAAAIGHERLGVLDVAGAGGGIADVADGAGAFETLEIAGVEDLRDEAHATWRRTGCSGRSR